MTGNERRRRTFGLSAVVLGAIGAAVGVGRWLFDSSHFMPHGHCYLWKSGLVGLHVGSDLAIGLSYVVISGVLLYVVHRMGRRVPFHWMFLAFGAFIVTCGATHLMEIWNLWHADYWAGGLLKLVCAGASVTTAGVLPFQIPRILALADAHHLAEQRRRELESANEELRSFSYTAAHDLRAPVRKIQSFVDLIMADPGNTMSAESRDYLGRVEANARGMAELIAALLDMSRVQTATLDPQEVDVAALAREIFADLRAEEPKRAVELVAPERLLLRGDPTLLRQAMANLLGNAFKFTRGREPGRIEVGERRRDGVREVFVRDNGVGFPPELAPTVFEPFRRLHSPREFAGHGIGLATVQRIALRHGGRVHAEANEGAGATVAFSVDPG